jgi:ABC-2 type transport system permease protein
MPIHDQGYRHYTGERLPPGQRWAVIFKAGVRTMLGRKTFIGLMLLAWAPFVVRAVQIYLAVNIPQAAAILRVTPGMFKDFLLQQDIFVFFITVYVGAGLIANDRRANALQIYLSKPLTRVEYIAGKLAILMTFILLVTGVPALVLLLVHVLFAGDLTFFTDNLHLIPAIVLFSLLEAFTASVAMLALSSLSKSARYVAVLYTAVIFLTQAIYGVLRAITGDTSIAWVSVSGNLTQLAGVLFRVPLEYKTPWPWSLAVIVALIVACGVILERRVRGVEVVT